MKLNLSTFGSTLRHWRGGVRLYLAIGGLLVTLEAWWWASLRYGGSLLFATRLEEFYAWTAVVLLVVTLLIGPLYKILPRLPAKRPMYEARRMLGIGAAWFATLHASLAYVSLFKVVNPLDLPGSYQQSFLLGSVALVILLLLAFTSFDRAFKGLGIWWFRLHRLVYVAVVLILMHAFMSGVHATTLWPLVGLSAASVVLVGMYLYLLIARRERPSVWRVLTLVTMILALLLVFKYGYHHNV